MTAPTEQPKSRGLLTSLLDEWLPGDKPDAAPKDPRDKTKSLVAARDSLFKLYMETTNSSLDRWQTAAQATRNSAAAIGAIYTAVLGIAFSVDNSLPPRGLLPAVFLGTAIVMATAYEAFPTKPKQSEDADIKYPDESDHEKDPIDVAKNYAGLFVDLVAERVGRRSYALRVAVLSLALGVAALPLGFIALGANVGTSDLPAWPDAPTGFESELANTLYEAQVTEVAKQRELAINADPGESITTRALSSLTCSLA